MAFDAKRFLEASGEGRTIMIYKAGATIFRQGDPAEHIYYLQQGTAKETVSGGRREALTGMLEAGMFFGTGAMTAGLRRRSTVTTISLCQVMTYSRDLINKALEEPGFVRLFLTYLLDRTKRIEEEKLDLLMNSREKRLAQKLLQLSHAAVGPPQRIGGEITQEMLAEMIGTTRPRVNFYMNKFRKLGYIQYNGGITVMPTLVKVLASEELDD